MLRLLLLLLLLCSHLSHVHHPCYLPYAVTVDAVRIIVSLGALLLAVPLPYTDTCCCCCCHRLCRCIPLNKTIYSCA
jgi:hypothetical protein